MNKEKSFWGRFSSMESMASKFYQLLAFKQACSFQFSSGIPQRNIKYAREPSIDVIWVC